MDSQVQLHREDSLAIEQESKKTKRKVLEPPQISRVNIDLLIGYPEEAEHDEFFEALENEMLRLEIPREWQSTCARRYMDDNVGYNWDKAWLDEEERANGRYKPSYQTIRDRMLATAFPNSQLKNKILNELYTPTPRQTARDAMDHLKTLVKQWNRLRQRHTRLSRLNMNLLKYALFKMLPVKVQAEIYEAAYDPEVSLPKLKVMITPFLDVTYEDDINDVEDEEDEDGEWDEELGMKEVVSSARATMKEPGNNDSPEVEEEYEVNG